MTTICECPTPIELARAHQDDLTLDHVASCATCQSTWRQLDELREAVGDLPWLPPGELQVRRVRGRVLHVARQRADDALGARSVRRKLSIALVVGAAAAAAVVWPGRGDQGRPSEPEVAVTQPATPVPAPHIAVVGDGVDLRLKITAGDAEFEVGGMAVPSADRDQRVNLHVTRGHVELQPSNDAARTLGPEQQWTMLAKPAPRSNASDAPTARELASSKPASSVVVATKRVPIAAGKQAATASESATPATAPAAADHELASTTAVSPAALSSPATPPVTPADPAAAPVAGVAAAPSALGAARHMTSATTGSVTPGAPPLAIGTPIVPVLPVHTSSASSAITAPDHAPSAGGNQRAPEAIDRKQHRAERKPERAERKEDRGERRDDRAERRRERAERREDRRSVRGR